MVEKGPVDLVTWSLTIRELRPLYSQQARFSLSHNLLWTLRVIIFDNFDLVTWSSEKRKTLFSQQARISLTSYMYFVTNKGDQIW